jgi:adenine-specific DNA methylase
MGQHLDPGARKALGAFYTDERVARYLVSWGIRGAPGAVLDPSCGDGRFLAIAGELGVRRLVACDIDPVAVRSVRDRLGASASCPEIHAGDFFALEPRSVEPVDLVVGNPPFIRYQNFSGNTRRYALASALRVGVRLSRLTSSWAPFLLHAIQFLSPGGRLAMVVPAEITQTQYGLVTLRAMLQQFRSVELLAFEKNLFDTAQEETMLLLASGKGGACREVGFVPMHSADDLAGGQDAVPRPEGVSVTLDEAGAQFTEALLSPEERAAWRLASRQDAVVRVRSVGGLTNGYVTGDNAFFHRTVGEAEAFGLPRSWLRLTARSSKSLRGIYYTAEDVADLEEGGTAHHLIFPQDGLFNADAQALDRFLEEGRQRGVLRRFKCRTRNPWWRVPGTNSADVLLGYMTGAEPKAAVNSAGAVFTNSLHGLRVREGVLPEAVALSFYTSLTRLSLEMEGRSYGGGVLKLEPTEMGGVLLSLPVIEERETADLARTVDSLLRRGLPEDVVDMADQVILTRALGLDREVVAKLRNARNRLVERRTNRSRKVTGKSPVPGRVNGIGASIGTGAG